MITVFNRKELATTHSIPRLTQIKQLLDNAGIEYSVKTNTSGVFSHGRAVTAKSGENRQEYTVYVRKSDFDEALHIIER